MEYLIGIGIVLYLAFGIGFANAVIIEVDVSREQHKQLKTTAGVKAFLVLVIAIIWPVFLAWKRGLDAA